MTDSAGHPSEAASDLKTRVISAAVLAPVALGATWAGGWFFAALLAAAALVMAQELARLLYGAAVGSRDAAGLAVAGLSVIVLATAGLPGAALAAAGAVLAFALAARSWSGRTMMPALIAYCYLVIPLVALVWLRNDPELGLAVTIWLLATVWAIDICAYFAGRFIGGPKLAPSISPKKTWAGLIGGMMGAAAVGVVTSLWIGAGSPLLLALIGVGMTVLEQAGDFFESALKRRSGVKDSGTLIPGHGGILDRVDGLVAVAAGAALLALLHNATHPGAGVLIWP
ncbi:MAG: phosphatidate cytidylyltransferase [Alphaproteobacteria bacterium HGW-Alphaproteobacteria-11]|nr:MAG: phosphatidate cytidylyltransferase [Alphaproteobacteria bacterium HGW-Alphaproteobacteria-11]